MNDTQRAIQQIESVQHISDCRRFSSGDIHGLVNGGTQLIFEVGKLCDIMRSVARQTSDSWAREYIVGRLKARGHDADLTDAVGVASVEDCPTCPHCGEEHERTNRREYRYDCDCGYTRNGTSKSATAWRSR